MGVAGLHTQGLGPQSTVLKILFAVGGTHEGGCVSHDHVHTGALGRFGDALALLGRDGGLFVSAGCAAVRQAPMPQSLIHTHTAQAVLAFQNSDEGLRQRTFAAGFATEQGDGEGHVSAGFGRTEQKPRWV